MSVHIKPVLTEKALQLASIGKFTFLVPTSFTKFQIKHEIGRIYGVNVREVATSAKKALKSTNLRRQIVKVGATKKAIVKLSDGQKIDAFIETK